MLKETTFKNIYFNIGKDLLNVDKRGKRRYVIIPRKRGRSILREKKKIRKGLRFI